MVVLPPLLNHGAPVRANPLTPVPRRPWLGLLRGGTGGTSWLASWLASRGPGWPPGWPPGPAWCRSSRGYWSATRLEALDPQGEGVDGPWESIVGVFYNDEAFNMAGRRLNACDSVSVLAMRFSHSLCCVSLGRVLRGAHRITEFGAATRRHIVPSLSQAFEVLKKGPGPAIMKNKTNKKKREYWVDSM